MFLVVVLTAGLLGLLGVRTGEVTTAGGGYEVRVVHASVTRPGLSTPWGVEVRRPGGFQGDTVTVATTSTYFDIFDENSLDPEPSESTSDGERMVWTFTAPLEGDTLSISLDARIEPGVQLTRARGETAVLEAGRPVATVRYSTLVLP